MKCPNKQSQEWKELVDEYGEDLAHFYWDITEDPVRMATGVDEVREKAVDAQIDQMVQRLLSLEKISAMESRKEVETRKAILQNSITRLSNERTYEKLMEVSLHQINQVRTTFLKEPEDLTVFEIHDAMKVIKNLKSITPILAVSSDIKVKKGADTISKWATVLDLKQKELSKNIVIDLAKKYNLPADKLFEAVEDESWLSSQTLGVQTSHIPLSQLISKVIQQISRQSNEILENEFDQKLRDLLKTLGKKNITYEDLKKITEPDGTLLKPFNKMYFNERDALWQNHSKVLAQYRENPTDPALKKALNASFKNVFNWHVESHDYYLTPEGYEAYKKDEADRIKAFTDINGDLTEEGERAKAQFIAEFNPYQIGEIDEQTGEINITAKDVPSTRMADGTYVYNKYWYRYLVAKPKQKYMNDKFDKVSQDPLYKFILDKYLEAMRMIPHETALDVGNFYKFIEEINFNTVRNEFTLKGMMTGIKDMAQNTYTISTNLAELEGGVIENVVDPLTGEITEKVTPLFRTTDEKGRPVPYLNPTTLEDIKKISSPKNPLELLREFYKMSVTYQHQVHSLSVLELLEHNLEQIPAINVHPAGAILRNAQNNPSTTEEGLVNALSQARYQIFTAISGKTKLDDSLGTVIKQETKEKLQKETEEWLKNKKQGPMPRAKVFSTVQTVDSIIDGTRLTLLGLKPFTAASNLFIGLLNNYTYAARKAEFEEKHLDEALKMLVGNVFNFYKIDKLTGKEFERAETIAALAEKFGITNTLYETTDPNIYRRSKNRVAKFLMALQEGGEFLIANQLMLALMLNTKVQDKAGKEVNLFDIFDKNGQIKPEFDHLEEWKSVEVIKDGENVSKLEKFLTTMDSIRHRTQGDYKNPIQAQKGVAGRVLMIFRRWIPQAVRERFGKENELLNFKGRYRTYRDLLVKKKGKGAWVGNLEFFGRTFLTSLASMTNLLPIGKYRFTKLSEWASEKNTEYLKSIGASKMDVENMRANIKELDLLFTMTILSLALMAFKKSDDGDDDDLMTINFLINLLNRSKQDLSFFMWPGSAMSVIKDPIPLYKTVQEVGDVLNVSWEYISTSKPIRFQKGIHKDELKLWKEIKDLMPVFSAIQSTESTLRQVFGQDAYKYTLNRD